MALDLLENPRNFTGAIILALGIALAVALSPFAVGLLGALVLHVLVSPMHTRLSGNIGSGRSAAVVVCLVALVVLIPGGAILGLLIGEGPAALRAVQDNALLSWLRTQRVGTVDIGAQLAKASGTIIEWVSAQALGFVGSAARGLINLIIALFGLYFLLDAGASVWTRVKRYLPFSDQNAEALRLRFVSVTQATFLGIIATAMMQGTLVGIGFALVGLPGAAFWGVMTGIASVIPVLGGALVWVPGTLVLLVEGEYGRAATLGAIGAILVTNIDNLVRPWIFRRVASVHPLVTLVGALAGLQYFGLLGVLMGPLAITYFFELLRIYDEEYGVTQAARDFAQLRTSAQLPAVAAPAVDSGFVALGDFTMGTPPPDGPPRR